MAGFLKCVIFCFGTSQCGVDVNKNDYEEVKECANDA